MTNSCIDDVAAPMRRLNLTPEELATLKVIVFCQSASLSCRISDDTADYKEWALDLIEKYKQQIINELFNMYQLNQVVSYEGE